MKLKHIDKEFYIKIKSLIENSRAKTYYVVSFAMIRTYWEVGRMIIEEEQNGKERAEYGKYLISELSKQLTFDIGKGFDKSNLSNMRMFYSEFPNFDAVRQELTWTHYRMLMRVENKEARAFYMNECIKSGWSTRQLQRQITSFSYERTLSKPNKTLDNNNQKQENTLFKPKDIIKNPYVLEFLDIKQGDAYLENELETELLNKLQQFLLELGRGFSFVARQKRVSTEANNHYYIDLVFYNYLLKCFVLIDLKVGTLTPQDVGQMDLYVRLYEKTLFCPCVPQFRVAALWAIVVPSLSGLIRA